MAIQDFHSTFTVPQPAEKVFAAITDPQKWWTGDIEGTARQIGDEFSYRYGNVHYSKQKVTDLEPDERVVWQVVESHLPGNDDPEEWNGTQITFEISRQEGKTEIRFSHQGLVPSSSASNRARALGGFTSTGASSDSS